MAIQKTKQTKSRKTRVYSVSQMNTYISCGRKYKFKYIDKIKPDVPKSDNLIVGSAHHGYFEDVLKLRINGKDFNKKKMDEARNVRMKEMVSELKDNEISDTSSYETMYDKITRVWDKDILPGLDPIAVEAEKYYEINGFKFVAYLDLINRYNKKEEIIDWKVVARKKSQNEVDDLLQLYFYSLITGIQNTAICSLTKTKVPAAHMVRSFNTDEDMIWCETVIRGILKGINVGYFPYCTTENYLCNEKYCEYWNMCRGKIVGKKQIKMKWAKK